MHRGQLYSHSVRALPDTNECVINPCANGGECIDGVGLFICACPDDFYGATCELGKCNQHSELISNTIQVTNFISGTS